MDTTYPTGLLV